MCGNMTFPETEGTEKQPELTKMSICKALKESVSQAKGDRRITCGIYACAKLLEAAPETVMLCIVPVDEGSTDVTNVLLHTLVEAFCWENEIRMLKVDSSEKLAKVLCDGGDVTNDNASTSGLEDNVTYSCVLIQYPSGEYSASDQSVLEHYNRLMHSNQFPTPIIEIPA